MKLLSGQSMKKNRFLTRLGKKIVRSATGSSSSTTSSSSAAVAIVVGRKRKVAVMGYVPKKLIYKFKSHWKQAAIGFQKKGRSHNVKYSYDIHSYSLNFDDGLCQ